MKNLAIYHHDDMDGKFAAGLIYEFEKNNYTNIYTFEVDYAKELPQIDNINTVYFLDYSFII